MENKIRNILLGIMQGNQSVYKMEENDLLQDYGLDSLKKIELIIRLEEEFQINIDTIDLKNEYFRSIKSICELLQKYNIVPS